MKNLCQGILVIATMLTIQNTQLLAQKSKEKENNKETCLQVEGLAVDKDGNPLSGVVVKLLKDNEEVEQQRIIGKEYMEYSLFFKLVKNAHYSIEVSKEGYVSRLISISTEVPNNIKIGKNVFIFEFELELYKTNTTDDEDYLDFPIALISYNTKEKIFKNHDNYTKHIKEKIQCCETANAIVGTN